MKTNLKKIVAVFWSVGFLGAGLSISQAAPKLPPSPIFTNGVAAWDCLVTGPMGQRGIMLLTFTSTPDGYGNYQFNMREIHTAVPASIPQVPVTTTNSAVGRGGSGIGRGNTGSGGSTVSTPAPTGAGTNVFGFLQTTGSWGYDYKGNILGFYIELIVTGVTSTNVTYMTNQVSFIGKATPNKRFTALYYSSIGGNGKYAGVPQKAVTNQVNGSDFSGPWTGNEISGPLNTVELFTLYPSDIPNAYDITGDGPGYTLDWLPYGVGPLTSKCLVSCQNKIAFSDNKYTTNIVGNLRATFGNLKNSTQVAGGITKGLLQPSGSNVVYNAYFVPYVPYP
jgi:hypothetical protein